MRRIVPFFVVASLLASCNVGQVISTGSALLPLITTSLDASCAGSVALSGQASAIPALSGASVLGKLNGKIASFCGKIDPASAQAGAALNQLNTLAATLLGTAGALGIKLPGLAR